MLGQLEVLVTHTAPYAHNSTHSSAHSSPAQSSGTARPTSTGEGTHEYTRPAHMQRWGLSHAYDCCHLTACSDTQCNTCTQRLQLHVCVGCNVGLTVNKQTNNHITLTCGSSPHSLRIRQGVCCRGTQRMHKRCKH